jgi:hypothetical protein
MSSSESEWVIDLKKAANKGYEEAIWQLGVLYATGDEEESVEKNTDLALSYFRKAIGKGSHIAANQLAGMYTIGDGVKQSTKKANVLHRFSGELWKFKHNSIFYDDEPERQRLEKRWGEIEMILGSDE